MIVARRLKVALVLSTIAVLAHGTVAQAADRDPKAQIPGQTCCASGNGWSPGEPSIAVSSNQVVETVNSSVTVYAKAGSQAQLWHSDLTSFFGGGSIACVDPRVIYLPSNSRFALVCTDIGTQPSTVRFAVSATSDATRAWYHYNTHSGFLDQPKIVATSDKVIVAGNGNQEEFYVYKKSAILAGATTSPVHLTGKNNLYQAVVEYTPTSNAFFVTAYACSGCTATLATISGSVPSVSLTEKTLGASQLNATTDPPIPGGQLGGGDMDTRVTNAVYEVETSDNKPVIEYSASSECVPSPNTQPTVCIALGRIDLSGSPPRLVSVTKIGLGGRAYTYGAVTFDSYGRVYVAYSTSSPTRTPSAAALGYWGGKVTFNTVMHSATLGTTACSPGNAAPCDERWGDYVWSTQDPTDTSKVWLASLYQASSGAAGWGTTIARASSTGLG